ncbi:MAG: aldo/keto reductase [Anaerolineae bacterium]|jgi:aryl-alcohol dehydrogenase-like predicted oxidoreductase
MEYRRLGQTGLKVSTICLGTMTFGWTADERSSIEIMSAAVDAGCNFFDTADIYSRWTEGNPGGVSETIIGHWLKGRNREEIIIATKVRGRMWDGPDGEGLGRAHIMKAVEASLHRLQTDYIDLYIAHWPDDDTPLEETLHALDDLIREGKVRYVGASNFPAWKLCKALWASDKRSLARFASLQPHYNLVHRAEFERELMDLCADQSLGVTPYSPQAGGFLTGKYGRGKPVPEGSRGEGSRRIRDYMTDANFDLIERVEEIGRDRGATVAQVSLAWVLANPVVTSAIIGANTVAQLQESIQAATISLTPEDKQILDEMSDWRS